MDGPAIRRVPRITCAAPGSNNHRPSHRVALAIAATGVILLAGCTRSGAAAPHSEPAATGTSSPRPAASAAAASTSWQPPADASAAAANAGLPMLG